jgi:predicted Zn-dependent peptidase
LAVTREDIQKIAKMLFNTDKRIVLIYNPKSKS